MFFFFSLFYHFWMEMITYFTKNIRCECYCCHEMCAFVVCVVLLSANSNQKHLRS